MSTLQGLGAVVAAYLLGGIPFGYIFYRLRHGRDVRDVGSGNIGATNLARASGWPLGLLTLLLDAGKGAGAVYLGLTLTGSTPWGAAAGIFAVAGHCYPAWLSFRGGKGVATGCGAFLVLSPLGMGVALLSFAVTLGLTRMVAAGSVMASVTFPLAAAALGAGLPTILWSAGACLLITIRHHENLKRILSGREARMFGRDGEEAG
jgi:glycerol-3-phosphate acyltransferase PlsY